NEAMAECDKQQGTVANVVKAGLVKYEEVKREGFDSERAEAAIQQEIEQATSLEMPMLEKNLVIISTLVSLGTLAGLLGTVTGMIKAFSALGAGSTPDSSQLANGISEALINTATGIGTSALAIIFYNLFTSKSHFVLTLSFLLGSTLIIPLPGLGIVTGFWAFAPIAMHAIAITIINFFMASIYK
ncbi:MAG: MotA/TolQ/ExbB proton channel family protein, partial [Sphingobacteriales bacterium]